MARAANLTGMKARILFVLAVAGIFISSYLVTKTNDPSSVICSLGGGCETVLSSSYAKLLGISVAWYGVAWYVATLAIIYFSLFVKKLDLMYLKATILAGLAFSLYLLGLEIFVIHAYCTWCLASLAVVVIMTAITFSIKNNNPMEVKS